MERRCRSFLLVVSLRIICNALRGCSNSASFMMLNP